ncbi:hypothetical protein [Microbacterium sp. NPDC079995]|uniref:hypothetical protein n=1 Tax=unclassified Microbacterium TaxID=2609290 RepID=UPI00344E4427
MSEPHSLFRIVIRVNDERFELAQDDTVQGLTGRVLSAVRAGGDFIELILLDGTAIHVLITAASQVVVTTEAVSHGPADPSAYEAGFEFDPDLHLGLDQY